MGARSIASRTRIVDGATIVLCSTCGEEKPWPEGFPRKGSEKCGTCRDCTNARKKRYEAEGRIKRNQQSRNEASERWRQRHPDRYRRTREAYLARIKADPVKHAGFLEGRRLEYRLRQERLGRALASIRAPKAMMVDQLPRMPVDALREAFERSQMSPSELASRLGWERNRAREGGESTRVLRALGIKSRKRRGRVELTREISYDSAARFAEALGLDGVDVGV